MFNFIMNHLTILVYISDPCDKISVVLDTFNII